MVIVFKLMVRLVAASIIAYLVLGLLLHVLGAVGDYYGAENDVGRIFGNAAVWMSQFGYWWQIFLASIVVVFILVVVVFPVHRKGGP